MQSRLVALTLGLYLCFTLFACSSKPSSTSTTENGTNSATGSNGGSTTTPTPPPPIVVPAGTVLTVRLAQAVGSKISQPGQNFSGTLATAVQIDGKDAIPAGANVSGTVVDAKPLGRFKGGAVLRLKLGFVNINGTDFAIETSSVVRSVKGKGKRTAVMAGGGAAFGAIVGGLVAGPKGALVGAGAGAGAGTAGAAFTGNKDIVLPAESAVSFKLEQPLEIPQ